jgi:hypothetical protein
MAKRQALGRNMMIRLHPDRAFDSTAGEDVLFMGVMEVEKTGDGQFSRIMRAAREVAFALLTYALKEMDVQISWFSLADSRWLPALRIGISAIDSCVLPDDSGGRAALVTFVISAWSAS